MLLKKQNKNKHKIKPFHLVSGIQGKLCSQFQSSPSSFARFVFFPPFCIASHTRKPDCVVGNAHLAPGGKDSVGNSELILIWKWCPFSRCINHDSHDTRGITACRFLLWYLHSVRLTVTGRSGSSSSQLLICLWEHLPLVCLVRAHRRVFTVSSGESYIHDANDAKNHNRVSLLADSSRSTPKPCSCIDCYNIKKRGKGKDQVQQFHLR